MRFSYQWLSEWVDSGLSPEDLGARLTMAGLELDALEPAAPAFSGVVVGEVVSLAPHPDADKLRVCQVSDGGDQPLQIVCGAPNVEVGMRVPFARVKAVLPGGMKIKKAKLRGVESLGMLCSAKELGLAESAEGLMPLPADAPVGKDLRDYLGLDDTVLEVDLTPNRADCLSIAGIARETALLSDAPLRTPAIEAVSATHKTTLPVDIQVPEACPRYAGRVIKGIDPRAETPLWMRERLRRCGLRSLGPTVDVTNYVLLELGQPMHAFDLDRLEGGIRVRLAEEDERLTLLDGQELTLKSGSLLICDHAGPQALAGVMGGQDSAVNDATRDIFLESAYFTPEAIAGKARQYGLHTDSSHRFERGVDPELQARAIERATALLLEIAGGQPGPLIDVAQGDFVAKRAEILLRYARIERLLGIKVEATQINGMLERLGCETTQVKAGWRVIPPSYRFDLAIEADLIEEIARVHGYDRIPSELQAFEPVIERRPEALLGVDRLHGLLIDRGYREAITYSFVDPETEALINPDTQPPRLLNPISSELAVMRGSLWPSLIKAAAYNLNRQQNRVRLFESGLSFVQADAELLQRPKLAGLIAGSVLPEQWGERPPRKADFFDLKGDVEALLALAGLDARVRFLPESHPALHPGQCARIELDGQTLGWLGALHPGLEKPLDLEHTVYLFELDQKMITRGTVSKFAEVSRYPAIRRDISILVDNKIELDQIKKTISGTGSETLREFHLFDVYTGEGVPKGLKSLSLGLILQDLSRTLTDEDVEGIIDQIVTRLEKDVGASLRV